MENENIEQLRELKARLLKQALELRDKLKNLEENKYHSSINFNM